MAPKICGELRDSFKIKTAMSTPNKGSDVLKMETSAGEIFCSPAKNRLIARKEQRKDIPKKRSQ